MMTVKRVINTGRLVVLSGTYLSGRGNLLGAAIKDPRVAGKIRMVSVYTNDALQAKNPHFIAPSKMREIVREHSESTIWARTQNKSQMVYVAEIKKCLTDPDAIAVVVASHALGAMLTSNPLLQGMNVTTVLLSPISLSEVLSQQPRQKEERTMFRWAANITDLLRRRMTDQFRSKGIALNSSARRYLRDGAKSTADILVSFPFLFDLVLHNPKAPFVTNKRAHVADGTVEAFIDILMGKDPDPQYAKNWSIEHFAQ